MRHSRAILRTVMATLSAIAMGVCTAPAEATTLTAPSGTVFTGTIEAGLQGKLKWEAPFTYFECEASEIRFQVEQHGSAVTASGRIQRLTYQTCNQDPVVQIPGILSIHALSNGAGTVSWSGARIQTTWTYLGGLPRECVYQTNGDEFGTLTPAPSSSGHALIDVEASMTLVAGEAFWCGEIIKLIGQYKIISPTGLTVD
jgi:hypothetical protein